MKDVALLQYNLFKKWSYSQAVNVYVPIPIVARLFDFFKGLFFLSLLNSFHCLHRSLVRFLDYTSDAIIYRKI